MDTYEKKYKEALKRAKNTIEVNQAVPDIVDCVESLFPELAESRTDERIRKGILHLIGCASEIEWCKANVSIGEVQTWLENQCEKTNPYSGISFEYNGHIWGMCARDNGVDILLDKQLFKHLEKQDEHKPVPKFKIGDTMRTLQEAKDGWIDGMPVVVSIDNEYYHCNNESIAIKNQDEYEYPPMNRKHDVCDSCVEQKPTDKV